MSRIIAFSRSEIPFIALALSVILLAVCGLQPATAVQEPLNEFTISWPELQFQPQGMCTYLVWEGQVTSRYYSFFAEIHTYTPVSRYVVMDQYGKVWGAQRGRFYLRSTSEGRTSLTIDVAQQYLDQEYLSKNGSIPALVFYIAAMSEQSVYPIHVFPGFSVKFKENLDSDSRYTSVVQHECVPLPDNYTTWVYTSDRVKGTRPDGIIYPPEMRGGVSSEKMEPK